ncbi:MAG: hypothetical protein RTU30_13835 [Candidatus Thorarchaeota archaeon]
MEPIGTITMYFPFIDSETKEIMQTILEEAVNYHDFVQKLNQKVCDEETTELSIFFATHHAAVLFDFKCLDKIARKYGKLEIIRPNLFIASAFQGKKSDLVEARAAVDEILANNPPEWLALEMLVIKFEAEMISYPVVLYDGTTFDTINTMMENNPELKFYRSRVNQALLAQLVRDGDIEASIEYIEEALSNAKEYNDINRLARVLRNKALIIQSTDLKLSLALLLKSLEILEPMGDNDGLADTIFQLSKIEAIRGEYDQAIEHLLRSITLRQGLGKPIGAYAITLSTLYNVTKNAQAGIEWAKMAEVDLQPSYKPRAGLNQVWSFLLQKKLTEAQFILDSIQDSILKSGLESHLASYYMITGILDMVEGNYSNAGSSMQEALDIFERQGAMMSVNICTVFLANIEVYSFESTYSPDQKPGTGPWLTLLEEKATSEDLPGILGQTLVLKAKLHLIQNMHEDFVIVVQRLNNLVKERELYFLQQSLDSLMKRV